MRRDRGGRPLESRVLILHNIMSDWTTGDWEAAEQAVSRMKLGLNSLGVGAISVPVRRDVAGALRGFRPEEYVIFNWCEGLDGDPNAYDKVPPVLEALGFTYTGANAPALYATTDKVITKEQLRRHRIPTPQAAVYSRPVRNGWTRFPALVKPATEHCSYGITPDAVVDGPEELRRRVEYVLDTWKCKALVEDFIDGVEINISLWGNGRIDVLPLAAIDYSLFNDYHERLCSYDAKWDPASAAYLLTSVQCPAHVDRDLTQKLVGVGRRAYRALRLRDYGRVDIRVRDGVPYVLDVNSNPDITMEGGFARSARAAGYDYGRTISHILHLASARDNQPSPVFVPAAVPA
ncbi:MAG: ATP-grasp domain-containing protein [Anaerolineales bacterium]|jgi:D-alanine-D-alanine ligase